MELGEPDPRRVSVVRGPRWCCLVGEPRLEVIWRKSTAGGDCARRVAAVTLAVQLGLNERWTHEKEILGGKTWLRKNGMLVVVR